jgi:hypothetical protein
MGIRCRADIGASTTLGTGIGVKEIIPPKLTDVFNAERVPLFKLLPRLGCDFFQAPEKAVWYGSEDVHVLAVGEIVQEAEEYQGVPPPKDFSGSDESVLRHAREKYGGNKAGYGHEISCAFNAAGDFAGVQTEKEDHQAGNEAQNDKGIAAAGLYVIGGEEDAASKGNSNTDQDDY